MNGIPDNPRRIQFPISTLADTWESTTADRLRGVPAEIVERVRMIQPFNRPEEEQPTDALLLLQSISNADKHQASIRARAVMAGSSHNALVQFADDAAAERNSPPNLTFYADAPFEDGALLAELRTVDPIEKAGGAWSADLRLVLETDVGSHLLATTLESLVQYVSTVLTAIYAGFEPPDAEVGWTEYNPTIMRDHDDAADGSSAG